MFIFYDITDAILLDNAGRFIMFSVITNITFCFNLYCGGFILFCNVCVCVCVCGFCNVCVCVGFVMCACGCMCCYCNVCVCICMGF